MSIFYKNTRLTHMERGEAYVWSKFLDKFESNFSNYKYDVRVGTKVILPDNSPAWLAKSAEMLSQKRIDVVMENSKNIFTVEVKVNAKSAVIGDLISYRHLYLIRFNPVKPVIPYLVASTIDADAIISLNELNILYSIV